MNKGWQMSRVFRGRWLGVLLCFLMLCVAWNCKPDKKIEGERDLGVGLEAQKRGHVVDFDETGETVIQIRAAGDGGAETTAGRVKTVQGGGLEQARLAQIYDRLPALMAEPDDKAEFLRRIGSKPRPRTGETVVGEFPPASERAPEITDVPAGPLEVLRFQPDGEGPRPPRVSVTFSQPMVAVTSHADTVAGGVPVELTPQPAGVWRWIGTKTLLFEPTEPFAMATDYTIRVKAGTKSAVGSTSVSGMATDFEGKFSTQPLGLVQMYPEGGPHTVNPVIFLSFNQKVQPEALLKSLEVKVGNKSVGFRIARADEIEADKVVSQYVKYAEENRWIAIKADDKFPQSTVVQVAVKSGASSAEGPRKTTTDQVKSFTTYGPFQFVEKRCGWQQECRPDYGWQLMFSNPLDPEQELEKFVKVAPEVADQSLVASHTYLMINGRTLGGTNYKVKVLAGLRDQFGQVLDKDVDVEFQVGHADPFLGAGDKPLVVIDPAGKATYSIYSINQKAVRVKGYKVVAGDWAAYMKTRYWNSKEPMPGKVVIDRVVEPKGPADRLTETVIDLAAALDKEGFGHVVLEIEPADKDVKEWRGRWPAKVWVQSTRIGLDAYLDPSGIRAWASSLESGKPLDGVSVTLGESGVQATTDKGGLASFDAVSTGKSSAFLIAKKGADSALLPGDEYGYNLEISKWYLPQTADELRWYVVDDRQMYKPGETVRIKGWTRLIEAGLKGDVALVAGGYAVRFKVMESRGTKFAEGVATVSKTGGFDFKIDIPDGVNLGYAYVEMELEGAKLDNRFHQHSFQIQEFRRPEFEVSASVEGGPHLLGEDVRVSVKASYYAGGALSEAPVNWVVTSREGSYSPPNHSKYVFGKWQPWWGHYFRGGWDRGGDSIRYLNKTDMTGEDAMMLGFRSLAAPLPLSVNVVAGVQDVNRQTWEATTTLLVHAASEYVGVRSDKMFVERGKPIEMQAIVTDIDGNLLEGRSITMVSHRLKWKQTRGQWAEEEVDEQRCEVKSKADEVQCSFETKEGGTYRIRATVEDSEGRKNLTELMRWVSGGEQKPVRGLEMEEVVLISDKQEYAVGEVAEILVQAPFYPAEGILTYGREGILKQERIVIEKPGHVLKVAMLEAYLPNLHVQVDLNGQSARLDASGKVDEKLKKRVAFASGAVNLSMSKSTRTLAVEVKPGQPASAPGSMAEVDVIVRDHAGKAVSDSELLVFVVDEAVLALSGYKLADPIEAFYQDRGMLVNTYRNRGYVLLSDPDTIGAGADGVQEEAAMDSMGGMRGSGGMAPPMAMAAAPMMNKRSAKESESEESGGGAIALRENFDALAAFEPSLKTDSEGQAKIQFKLPDNLTRYRVMAVAFSGKHDFGTGESAMVVRLPLMVRASAPRFLNFGDVFELPVVVQNQTDKAMEVEVAVRGTNVEFLETPGAKVKVAANDRLEVRFKAKTEKAGIARFQVGVSSGLLADATSFEFPVYTPATTEAFATYGEIDKSSTIVQPVAMPGGVFEQFGGLELTTSSTELQALTDAFISLLNYPFMFSEQIASRMLAIAALRDVLTAFEAEGMPTPAEIAASMKDDLELLQRLQNSDGGFGFWSYGEKSYPFVSIHVAHALRRAQAKGYEIPATLMTRSEQYLVNIERNIPADYGQQARYALTAYAQYVRAVGGKPDLAGTRALYAKAGIKELTLEAQGWILAVLATDPEFVKGRAEILKDLNNRVEETAATAEFRSDYGDSGWYMLYTSRRSDGVLLDALIAANPKSDLIPKLVRGLLGHRSKGQWGSTQDNVFVLLGLEHYFRVFEKETPNFVARAWLGKQFVGEHSFKGRTTERQHVDVPMAYLAEQGGAGGETTDFAIQKDGKGRMYYRLGMRYAPKSLMLKPADHGFAVERVYESVDDAGDVKQREDGVWEVKAGARVKVTLTMAAPARRYHVALVDYLPAGFEPLNSALATTTLPVDAGSLSSSKPGYWWWIGTWYEHQNMRDERVEAFSSLVWGGVQTYTYFARATTPGEFIAPPAKAEEMYHPETFGRTASERVIVK